MRAASSWCVLGLFGVALQAILAGSFPGGLVPDLSLLVVVAAALVLGPAEGLVVACVLGLGADMVSGSPLGEHGFVRMVEFGVVRGVARQLDLRWIAPQVVVGFTLSAFDAALMAGVSLLFVPAFAVSFADVGGLVSRAGATALAAPLVGNLARRVTLWLSETEARREMRLETRRPMV